MENARKSSSKEGISPTQNPKRQRKDNLSLDRIHEIIFDDNDEFYMDTDSEDEDDMYDISRVNDENDNDSNNSSDESDDGENTKRERERERERERKDVIDFP